MKDPRFLHSHDGLIPNANEEHVLVDKRDWEIAQTHFAALREQEARKMTNEELFYKWWDSDDSDQVRMSFSMDDARPIWDAALRICKSPAEQADYTSALREVFVVFAIGKNFNINMTNWYNRWKCIIDGDIFIR